MDGDIDRKGCLIVPQSERVYPNAGASPYFAEGDRQMHRCWVK
jgi:hypothetical protein